MTFTITVVHVLSVAVITLAIVAIAGWIFATYLNRMLGDCEKELHDAYSQVTLIDSHRDEMMERQAGLHAEISEWRAKVLNREWRMEAAKHLLSTDHEVDPKLSGLLVAWVESMKKETQ